MPDKMNTLLSKHLFSQMYSSQSFDVLFLFHSLDFSKDVCDYFQLKIGKHATKQTRFALAFYHLDPIVCSFQFERSKFSNSNVFASTRHSTLLDIRTTLLNLDWNSKSHKLVINLAYDAFWTKYSREYTHFDNQIGQQLKYVNIHFITEILTSSHVNKSTVDSLMSETFLLKHFAEILRVAYWKELYYLKRKAFASFETYEKSRREKSFANNYNNLFSWSNAFIKVNYESFAKESELSKPMHRKNYTLMIKTKRDVIEPTRNLFLTWAECDGIKGKVN